MGHDFSRKIMEKCGNKYENENYILGRQKWKWELSLLYKGREEQCCPLLECLFYPPSLSKLQKECQNQNRLSKKTNEN